MQLFKINKKLAQNNESFIINTSKTEFGAIWRLFNRYFLKSFFGPFFTYAFPILLFAILGALMGYKIMFPGIIAMSALSAGISGMPFAIMELKQSVLLKRIGASPVKQSKFTFVILSYYVFNILLSIFWVMLWGLIISQDTAIFKSLGTVVGFFGFFYGNLLNICMSLGIGFVISSFAKSPNAAQVIGMIIYFPSTFLSGQFIAPHIIASNPVMNIISQFLPFRYTTMIISESWQGEGLIGIGAAPLFKPEIVSGNPFLIHDYGMPTEAKINLSDIKSIINDPKMAIDKILSDIKVQIIWNKLDHILAYIIPYFFIFSSIIISIKTFRWSAAR